MELRQITPEELKEITRKHRLFVAGEEGGERANLRNADLRNARGKVLSIGPIGSRCGITYAFWADNDIQIQCGCFRGTLAQWGVRCKEIHGDSAHGQVYATFAQSIKATAAAYKWTEGK